MNVLIIPASNWVFMPPTHVQELAERLGEKDKVYGIYYYVPCMKSKVYTLPRNVKLIEMSTFARVSSVGFQQILNALSALTKIINIVKKYDINVIINENIFLSHLYNIIPNNVLKVFDFSDFFPDSATIYYPHSPLKDFSYGLAWFLTKCNLENADICISPSKTLLKMAKERGCNKEFFLPNSVDTEFYVYSHRYRMSIRRKLKIRPNDVVFVIVGVVEPWIDFEIVFEGLKMLKSIYKDHVKLLIVGSSITGYDKSLKMIIKEKGLEGIVYFTDYLPTSDVPKYLSAADIGVISYVGEQINSVVRLPVKFFIYSSMSLPVLSTPLPEISSLNPRHVMFFNSAEEFFRLAVKLLENRDEIAILRKYARVFAKKYDIRKIIEEFREFLLKEFK